MQSVTLSSSRFWSTEIVQKYWSGLRSVHWKRARKQEGTVETQVAKKDREEAMVTEGEDLGEAEEGALGVEAAGVAVLRARNLCVMAKTARPRRES